MTDIAIRVDNLRKRYRIGQREPYKALRDVLTSAMCAPFRRLRRNPKSEFRNANSEYIWALKDVSFEVKQGEVIGIIGRNGAGKTTLLKILSRITEPTEGYAEIHGRASSLLEVGTGFHPELTGRENIYLNGAILGMRKAEIDKKFDEIVAFTEIEKFIDTPVKYYSSGMYVRLAFSVAAHLEPEILLVDEVLAVGDAAFQKKCLGKMGGVAKEGRTVLFVSHNMAAVRSLCSRAFLLDSGKVCQSGPVEICIDRYLIAADTNALCELNTLTLPRPTVVVDDKAALRITRVKLDTPNGHNIVKTGEPIVLIICFKVFQPLHNVVFGFTVESSDNVRLCDCRSSDSCGPISYMQPGDYSIRAVVQSNPLNPGTYRLSLGARSESKGLDYLPDLMILLVETSERFESLWLENPSGLFRVFSDWTLQSN